MRSTYDQLCVTKYSDVKIKSVIIIEFIYRLLRCTTNAHSLGLALFLGADK